MHIGVYQSDVGGLSKQARIGRLKSVLHKRQLDLVICPELFMSGYNIGDQLITRAESAFGEFSGQIGRLARSFETAIVYGYPEKDGDSLYNAALCIDAKGEIIANYRKLMLPPGFEASYFRPGDQITYFKLGQVKCAILICYDVEYPESVRIAAENGAQVVLVPTALSDKWGVVAEKVIPARAFENGVWVVYANHAGVEADSRYFGGSCIVNPVGQDVCRANADEALISAQIDVNEVEIAQTRLPYLKDVQRLRDLLSSATDSICPQNT